MFNNVDQCNSRRETPQFFEFWLKIANAASREFFAREFTFLNNVLCSHQKTLETSGNKMSRLLNYLNIFVSLYRIKLTGLIQMW